MTDGQSPGEEIADVERAFWKAYRELKGESGYERRRLAREASRLHLRFRSHRQARQDAPAVPPDIWLLPPDDG